MTTLRVNRAPVLTLWAAVVAKRLGYKWNEALTLGRALAGLNAQSKGQALGLFEPGKGGKRRPAAPSKKDEPFVVELMGRAIPVVRTDEGMRALSGKNPMDPKSVERYLEGKFGEALPEVRSALQELASSLSPEELAREAFALYESFRPSVPRGARGWGAAGTLDLERMRALATQSRRSN